MTHIKQRLSWKSFPSP